MNFDFSALNFETIDSNINAYPDIFLNQNGVTITKRDGTAPLPIASISRLCFVSAGCESEGICDPFLQEQRTEGLQVLQAERRTERCCYDLQQESA